MTGHVTNDGVRLHVEITGHDEAPTVVLVHVAGSVALGWRASGVHWDHLARHRPRV
ncbi:MAG: hypothetical protein ACRDQ5_16405 [Sciscionella sp.]